MIKTNYDMIKKQTLEEKIEVYYEILTELKQEHDTKGIDMLKRSLRKARRELETLMKTDSRIINYLDDSAKGYNDSYIECYIISAKSELDVWQFIHDNNLNTEYIQCKPSLYDCTGQEFGGNPCIRRLTDNSYVLSYHWYLDV